MKQKGKKEKEKEKEKKGEEDSLLIFFCGRTLEFIVNGTVIGSSSYQGSSQNFQLESFKKKKKSNLFNFHQEYLRKQQISKSEFVVTLALFLK